MRGMDLVTNSHPLEWAFVVVSVIMTAVTFYSLREAIVDASWLTAERLNGPRKIIADSNIREEFAKLAVGVIMLVASLSSLVLEPPPPGYVTLPQTLVIFVAWILVGTVMGISSLLGKSARRKLQQYAPVEVETVARTLEAPGDCGSMAETLQTDAQEQGRKANDDAAGRRVDGEKDCS